MYVCLRMLNCHAMCRGLHFGRFCPPNIGNRGFNSTNSLTAWRILRNQPDISWNVQPILLLHTSIPFLKGKAKKGKKMDVFIDPRDAEEFIDLNAVFQDMTNATEKLKHDYVHDYRVGIDSRFLGNIVLNLEGMKLKLHEVAKIHKKSERIIELDFVSFPEAIKPAISAIQSSSYNLNPSFEGTKLEVPVPAVTAQHRKGLAKNAKQRMNEAKEEIRRARNYHEKKLKGFENLPKDTDKAIRKQIGAYVEITQAEAEKLFKAKEKDLLLK